jgi:hypothetical protein
LWIVVRRGFAAVAGYLLLAPGAHAGGPPLSLAEALKLAVGQSPQLESQRRWWRRPAK